MLCGQEPPLQLCCFFAIIELIFLTALVTPFKKDGKIDFECFIKLIEYQIRNGTDALIICGTTGEGSTLSVDEKLMLFDIAVKTVKKRIPIIAGTGSNSTSFALNIISYLFTFFINRINMYYC